MKLLMGVLAILITAGGVSGQNDSTAVQTERNSTFTRTSDLLYITVAQAMAKTKRVKLYGSAKGRFAYVYDKKKRGFVLITSEFCNFDTGYRGPTIVALYIDVAGKVLDIEFLESPDTEEVVKKLLVSKYLKNFIGATKETEVDVVSGASFTTAAVNSCVYVTLRDMAEVLNGLEIKKRSVKSDDAALAVELLKR